MGWPGPGSMRCWPKFATGPARSACRSASPQLHPVVAVIRGEVPQRHDGARRWRPGSSAVTLPGTAGFRPEREDPAAATGGHVGGEHGEPFGAELVVVDVGFADDDLRVAGAGFTLPLGVVAGLPALEVGGAPLATLPEPFAVDVVAVPVEAGRDPRGEVYGGAGDQRPHRDVRMAEEVAEIPLAVLDGSRGDRLVVAAGVRGAGFVPGGEHRPGGRVPGHVAKPPVEPAAEKVGGPGADGDERRGVRGWPWHRDLVDPVAVDPGAGRVGDGVVEGGPGVAAGAKPDHAGVAGGWDGEEGADFQHVTARRRVHRLAFR